MRWPSFTWNTQYLVWGLVEGRLFVTVLTLFLGLTQEYLPTKLFMLAEPEMLLPYATTEHCLAKGIKPATEQLQFRYFVLVFGVGI
jgi:hypothetical protein